MRTGADYVANMRDGREVWYRGERVPDVTTHPVLGRCVANRAHEYDLHHDSRYHDALSYELPSGERRCIGYLLPRSSADVTAHRIALETLLNATSGVGDVLHAYGPGGTGVLQVLAALAAGEWRSSLDVRYRDNIQTYFEHCAREDLSLSVGSNDAKGNRARLPFEQDDPDMFTRVVAERADGLIIRGVKKVCTAVAYSDEVLISTNFRIQGQIPTPEARARMAEHYTFLCALPLNSPGLKVLCRPSGVSLHDSRVDHPVSWYDEIDGMVVLDDVLVPWERVLVYQDLDFFIGWLCQGFAQPADFDLCISTASRMELLVGAGSLATRSNGTLGTPAAQSTLGRLVAPLEALRLFIRAAEERPDVNEASGFMLPSSYYCHLGLNEIFDHLGEMMGTVADIMGGTTVTSQSSEDLAHPELGPLLDKFFSRPGFSGEQVVRLGRFLQDLTCSAYALREQMYVRLALGDVARKRQVLYQSADLRPLEQKVWRVLDAAAPPVEGGGRDR